MKAHQTVYNFGLCSDYVSIDYWTIDYEHRRLVNNDVDSSGRTGITLVLSKSGEYHGSSLVPMACRILAKLLRNSFSPLAYVDLVKLGIRKRVSWLCERVKDKDVLKQVKKLQAAVQESDIKWKAFLGEFEGKPLSEEKQRSNKVSVVLSDRKKIISEDEKENGNSNSTKPPQSSSTVCSNCDLPNSEVKLKKCGGCGSVQYCGRYTLFLRCRLS